MVDRDILIAYEEYCTDCIWEGKTPVSFWRWLGGEDC